MATTYTVTIIDNHGKPIGETEIRGNDNPDNRQAMLNRAIAFAKDTLCNQRAAVFGQARISETSANCWLTNVAVIDYNSAKREYWHNELQRLWAVYDSLPDNSLVRNLVRLEIAYAVICVNTYR